MKLAPMGANKMEEAALHMLVMARRYVVCGIRTYFHGSVYSVVLMELHCSTAAAPLPRPRLPDKGTKRVDRTSRPFGSEAFAPVTRCRYLDQKRGPFGLFSWSGSMNRTADPNHPHLEL